MLLPAPPAELTLIEEPLPCREGGRSVSSQSSLCSSAAGSRFSGRENSPDSLHAAFKWLVEAM